MLAHVKHFASVYQNHSATPPSLQSCETTRLPSVASRSSFSRCPTKPNQPCPMQHTGTPDRLFFSSRVAGLDTRRQTISRILLSVAQCTEDFPAQCGPAVIRADCEQSSQRAKATVYDPMISRSIGCSSNDWFRDVQVLFALTRVRCPRLATILVEKASNTTA